eukprot:2550786-Amphidinium_carterae.1
MMTMMTTTMTTTTTTTTTMMMMMIMLRMLMLNQVSRQHLNLDVIKLSSAPDFLVGLKNPVLDMFSWQQNLDTSS